MNPFYILQILSLNDKANIFIIVPQCETLPHQSQ